MFTAPELVVSEVLQVFDKFQVALELQDRTLADGMVWCKERTEAQVSHIHSLGIVRVVGTERNCVDLFDRPYTGGQPGSWGKSINLWVRVGFWRIDLAVAQFSERFAVNLHSEPA